MENNTQVLTKRVWSLIRVAFFMLRKGVSKGKLMMNLNTMLKRRRKLAGKAISNLMSHHHHHHSNSDASTRQFTAAREYEFSCSNTPHNFFTSNKRNNRGHNNFFTRSHAQLDDADDTVTANAVKAVLEMLNNEAVAVEAASPALPGFGRSPMVVRQLRVTDSPFPDNEIEGGKDGQVDKAAEEFIKRFYMQLRHQD